MKNVKWVKVPEVKKVYSICTCTGCGEQRDLDKDPALCPTCGYEDFSTNLSAVFDIIAGRTKNLVCNDCPTSLDDERVNMFPHSDGWKMSGVAGKWWMSIKCPQCGYSNAFTKFGIMKN